MLEKNQIAPEFTALNQAGEEVTLRSLREDQTVVLYFYPKDDTPGCTIEANDFTALAPKFSALSAVVVGVSKDSCQSHANFIKKFNLQLDLLADESGKICESYGVWQEKEKNGVKKMAILRSTFIISKHGPIVETYYGVDPKGHAQIVLARLKQLVYRVI